MELREVLWHFKKPVRTAQSYFPALKEAKDGFYRTYRRSLRLPSEPFYAAVGIINKAFNGSYIDIGANTGQSIESIKLYAPDARIFSFEPNPNLAAKLTARYRTDASVTIRGVGLSSAPGQMTLHVPSYRGFVYDGLGSLAYDSARSWLGPETIYFFDPDKLKVHSFDCAIETLDMQAIDNPVFIKIDVEGAELDVLKGATDTITRYRPILSIEDLHGNPEIDALLKPLGYSPFRFDAGRFSPGHSPSTSFLITPERMEAIKDASARQAAQSLATS